MKRGSGSRPARVVINTTPEVKAKLEEIARLNGWSLSRVAHLALVEGLKVWGLVKRWEPDVVVDGLEVVLEEMDGGSGEW